MRAFRWEVGWLGGRHRWQASSHSWSVCIQLGIGRLGAAFASRLAPTVGMRAFRWEVGRLVGRHRWQASSHSWNECIQLGIGRLGGRFREQARSHRELCCSQNAEHPKSNVGASLLAKADSLATHLSRQKKPAAPINRNGGFCRFRP